MHASVHAFVILSIASQRTSNEKLHEYLVPANSIVKGMLLEWPEETHYKLLISSGQLVAPGTHAGINLVLKSSRCVH